MSRYLVTGGAGFIGSHIVEELVTRGDFVRIIDNFITGKKENVAAFLGKIELLEGDIRDFDACRKAVDGIDYVLHQAALPSVPRSVENPQLTNDINIDGTLNILLASRDAKIKRLVFASSSSVYGDDPSLPKKEGAEGTPLSPYALSKVVGELYCKIFSRLYGLSTVSLRYFNIFGPRQDPYSQYAAVIPNFITKIIQGERFSIYGDGKQSRDFTYVSNAVQANMLALEAGESVSGEAFNLACGYQTSVNSLASEIIKIEKVNISPIYEKPRPGDVKHSFADISKAEKILRYKPAVSFERGLGKTIQWYKEKLRHE